MNAPPAEWPMRIGGESSPPMTSSSGSMIAGTVSLGDHRRVGVQRLDLDLETRIRGREDLEAALLVVGDPVLPAARGHPEAVDEDDGVGKGGVVLMAGTSSSSTPAAARIRRDAQSSSRRAPNSTSTRARRRPQSADARRFGPCRRAAAPNSARSDRSSMSAIRFRRGAGLIGDPGVGKSTLLRAAASSVPCRNVRVGGRRRDGVRLRLCRTASSAARTISTAWTNLTERDALGAGGRARTRAR